MTWHESGPYQAVGWRFAVRCSHGATGDALAHALSSLRTDGATTAACYELTTSGGPGAPGRLVLGDEEIAVSPSDAVLYATLLWHVNRGVVEHSADHVLLHASAAERDGAAVVMSAPTESGKTTLVAGLVQAGLRYLTDETVAIRPEDGTITPYPKALSVDEGSWEILAHLRPDLRPDMAHLLGAQWQVPPETVRPDAVGSRAVPQILVLPRYVRGAATVLTPVTRAAALFEVLGQVFEPDRARGRDLRVLAEVVRGCETYRLVTGSLDEAVVALLGVLEQTTCAT